MRYECQVTLLPSPIVKWHIVHDCHVNLPTSPCICIESLMQYNKQQNNTNVNEGLVHLKDGLEASGSSRAKLLRERLI